MSQLTEVIEERIRKRGRITFAEFMDLALYYPGLGYYTSSRTRVGAAGDFFTSPDAHPVFAALVSLQLEQMWRLMGSPAGFTIVEMGAGKGLLARDILGYLPHLSPQFGEAVSYVTREQDDATVLKGNAGQAWPLRGVTGCFLSNELPDAFPVHRVAMRDGRLQEVYVALEDGSFVDLLGEPSTPALADRFHLEAIVLPEGYSTEVCLAIDPWVKEVAAILDRGFVLTIDYGYESGELYAPRRRNGTLMTYFRHACGSASYIRVGEQDITSHVDFTAVMRAGASRGLHCEALLSQRDFLLNLGHSVFVEALARKRLVQGEQMANRMSMLELVREEGMGSFKVLLQSKGLRPGLPLHGAIRDNEGKRALRERFGSLHVPLLDAEHTPLLQGKYPQYWETDNLITGQD